MNIPSKDLKNESQKDFMLAEYNMLRAELKMFNEFLRRDTQLLFVVLGGLSGVVLYQGDLSRLQYLVLAVPSILFVYCCMQVLNLSVSSSQVKACAEIENAVNKKYGDGTMRWENYHAKATVRSPISAPFISVVGVLAFLMFVFLSSAIFSHAHFGWKATSLHLVEFVILFTILVIFGRQELQGK